ncbi:hypothetical protein D4759_23930 [Clostridiales bacterium AHG0011]|nr:hypothetical protein [Clostridiales bacterium AHG0011]
MKGQQSFSDVKYGMRKCNILYRGFQIRCSTLHCGHFTAAISEPVSHFEELSGDCTKRSDFLRITLSKVGNNEMCCCKRDKETRLVRIINILIAI